MPYSINGGPIIIQVFLGQTTRIYETTGSYPVLQENTFTGTSLSRSILDNQAIGQNGNIDCVMKIPFTSSLYPIKAIQVDFLNSDNNEISIIYSFCEAFLMDSIDSVVRAAPIGQL